MRTPYPNELMHYGILGMKWGIRRYQNPDGTLTEAGKKRYAENYSEEQRKRDKQVYGRAGVRRINKRMLRGDSISAARSAEANKIYGHRRAAITGGQVGSTIGTVGGAVGGYFAGKAAVKVLSRKYPEYFNSPMSELIVSGAVASGVASVGSTLGRHGGRSIAMLSGGYSPTKFRYN